MSDCNGISEGAEGTGAISVVDLQGQGDFDCSTIALPPLPDGTPQSMQSTPVMITGSGTLSSGIPYVNWETTGGKQADLVFVTAGGNGSRCLYNFDPGQYDGQYLSPGVQAKQTTLVACTDGIDEPANSLPVEEPISTSTNCDLALPDFSGAFSTDPDLITFIGIGTDRGLNDQGDADGDYILAVCSSGEQSQCVDLCRQPVLLDSDPRVADETAIFIGYGGTTTSDIDGALPLSERPCATHEEIPNEKGFNYCWEYSHRVNLSDNSFVPPKEKETGVAYWEQYKGSTCVKITTSYAGRTYSYWTPSGCYNQ